MKDSEVNALLKYALRERAKKNPGQLVEPEIEEVYVTILRAPEMVETAYHVTATSPELHAVADAELRKLIETYGAPEPG